MNCSSPWRTQLHRPNEIAEATPDASADTGSHDAVLRAVERLRDSVAESVASWAERPPENAFVNAEEFVRAWVHAGVAMPHVGVSDDGEMNFLWNHNRGTHVDLGFHGDGTRSYFARDCDGERYWKDDVPVGGGLTDELLRILVEQD